MSGTPLVAAVADIFTYRTVGGLARKINMADFIPTKLDTGKWLPPKLSRLQYARYRRECLDAGIHDHPFTKTPWNHKPVVFKGQKFLVKQRKREEIIAQKMKDMPTKMEEYYTNLRSRRVRAYDPLYIIRHGFGRMK